MASNVAKRTGLFEGGSKGVDGLKRANSPDLPRNVDHTTSKWPVA